MLPDDFCSLDSEISESVLGTNSLASVGSLKQLAVRDVPLSDCLQDLPLPDKFFIPIPVQASGPRVIKGPSWHPSVSFRTKPAFSTASTLFFKSTADRTAFLRPCC